MMQWINSKANIGAGLLGRIGHVLSKADNTRLEALVELLLGARRLFVMGAGRSGLVGRFFAMRMMHLGKEVYVAGETNTPRIGRDDLLLIVSASADSLFCEEAVRKSQAEGARVALITQIRPESTRVLPAMVDCCIELERRANLQERWNYSRQRQASETVKPYPMGSLFECSVLMMLESLVSMIIVRQQVPEEAMIERHTILE
jgi:6-phospho 3-hexuloisomerase